MTSDHPTEQLLDGYRKRILSPDVFLSVHRHVESCSGCHKKCLPFAGSEQDYVKLYSALLEPEAPPHHLRYDEIEAYVNSQLDDVDVETIETHLEVCAECKKDLDALREIKESLARDVGSRVEEIARSPETEMSFTPPQAIPRHSAPYWIAAAVLVIVAFVIFQAINNRKKQSELNATESQHSKPHAEDDNSRPDNEGPREPAPQPPRVGYSLVDGARQVMIDEQGSVQGIGELPVRLQQAVQYALRNQEVERPSVLTELHEKPTTLSGPDNHSRFQVLSPVGAVIETNRPTFRWTRLNGAINYTVIVTDAKLNEVATSPPLNGLDWKITRALEYGAIYTWQVTALKDGELVRSPVLPEPQAKFKVLDLVTLKELNALRRTQSPSHLALAVLYAHAGLVDDAEQEFRILARENPNLDVIRNLLRSVQSFKRN
jgi:hypothetical protein